MGCITTDDFSIGLRICGIENQEMEEGDKAYCKFYIFCCITVLVSRVN